MSVSKLAEAQENAMQKRKHRLDITLEDVAHAAGVSLHTIYSDVKRGNLDKNSLSSIIEYIYKDRKTESLPKDRPVIKQIVEKDGFLL